MKTHMNHFSISMVKSVVRILSCAVAIVTLWKTDNLLARVFCGFAGAEIIGIVEEIGE